MKNEEGDLKYHPGPDSRRSTELKGARGAFHDYSRLENSESLIRKPEDLSSHQALCKDKSGWQLINIYPYLQLQDSQL